MEPIKRAVMLRLLTALLVAIGVASCRPTETYFQYRTVAPEGWNKDSALIFRYHIPDTARRYDIFVHVRHWGNYPYQNFWLFLEHTDARDRVSNDTIECYLADTYGKWFGQGRSVKEMPVFYKQQLLLPDSGTYCLTIRHGMRDNLLAGIKEIGVRVEPARR